MILSKTDYRVVSFGKDHTLRPLRELMGHILKDWPSDPGSEPAKKRFETYFQWKTIEVDDTFSAAPGPDKTLCILLRDELVGERYLFPNGSVVDLAQRWETFIAQRRCTPEKFLFQYLLQRVVDEIGVVGACWGQDAYLPFPMIRRISDIVYRLRPETCLNVPIKIDQDRTRWVYIPRQVEKTDERTKNAIANLILGVVENRAMASGMQFAEIDLENLCDDCGQDAEPGPMMGLDEWKDFIREMHTEGGYNTLLERYVRDYNTRRETVRFSSRLGLDLLEPSRHSAQGLDSGQAEISLDRAGQVAVGAVRKGLGDYLAAHKEQVCTCPHASRICLVGVDIGGTRTKCQLFWYDDGTGEIEASSPVLHMDTRSGHAVRSDDDKDKSDRLKKQAGDFATRIVRLVKKELDDRRTEFDCRYCRQVIVGLSWPGPIRDRRIVGTSGALEFFPPLTKTIAANAIEDIWQLDIVAAVESSWGAVFKGDPNLTDKPYVSLLNDGDAEAVGAIMRYDQAAEPDATAMVKTAVVKIGTGLAGGLLEGASERIALVSGLYEWGKLILDVGAPKKQVFPQGVAAEYLSKRCLPRLAARKGRSPMPGSPGCFQQDDPESAEIGLILEMFNKPSEAVYKRLVNECGIIQAQKNHLHGIQIPAETLRLLLDPERSSPLDDDLHHLARLALGRYGEIEPQLQRELEGYGLERLRRLISYGEKKPLIEEINGLPEWEQVRDHALFKAAGPIAKECVELLGGYLGDFCVLLFDELDVNRLILTGGVLSGETGEVARKAASDRVAQYGLMMEKCEGAPSTFAIWDPVHPDPQHQYVGSGVRADTAADRNGFKEDRGTLGAACYSAAAFIQSRRSEGLQRLRAILLPLSTGSRLNISGNSATISEAQGPTSRASEPMPVNFLEYALTGNDLLEFLDIHGVEWGYYRAADDHSFVRWLFRD